MKAENSKKLQKILTLNDAIKENERYDLYKNCLLVLFEFMRESNIKNKLNLQYFSIRTRDNFDSPFSKDMVLEWFYETNSKEEHKNES
jgi:hypothetical protein